VSLVPSHPTHRITCVAPGRSPAGGLSATPREAEGRLSPAASPFETARVTGGEVSHGTVLHQRDAQALLGGERGLVSLAFDRPGTPPGSRTATSPLTWTLFILQGPFQRAPILVLSWTSTNTLSLTWGAECDAQGGEGLTQSRHLSIRDCS